MPWRDTVRAIVQAWYPGRARNAVVLGAALTLRPYSSLEAVTVFVGAALVVTGFGELLDSRGDDAPWRGRVVGAVLVVTGVLVVALPGLSASSVAIIAGGGLVVAGVIRLAAVARRRYAGRSGGSRCSAASPPSCSACSPSHGRTSPR